MKKTTVPIKGMHCPSCEILIEDELSQVPGVCKVYVSEKKAIAEVYYETDSLGVDQIEQAVLKAGYEVGLNDKKPWLSRNITDYADIFYAGVALFFLYVIVNILGVSKLLGVGGGHPTSLVTVLIIGLTAGFSTCMALIGGLVLGTATRYAQKHPNATNRERFTPHLWFTAGRIVSYTVLGGIIGGIGSFFQFSGFSLGLLTLAVALVMLTLGMQLTGLFPRLEGFKLSLPKGVARLFGIKDLEKNEYSHQNSFVMGASTFFLPCGFTQAMQLYAMSSGNVFSGAMIMGVFAVGTAPGLLGIGGLTSVIRGVFAQKFFKFAGVAVMALSLFNINNALNLIGWNPVNGLPLDGSVLAAAIESNSVLEGDVQIVRMTQDARGYSPNSFTITKGVPVKWIVNSTDVNTCASSIVSSQIGVRVNLHPGENIIEFTPKSTGTINFSCMMGMYRGSFTVVDSVGGAKAPSVNVLAAQAPVIAAAQPDPSTSGAGGSCGGGGCACGGAKKPVVEQVAPTVTVKNDVQIIKTTYTADADISPNTFTVKAGVPVRMEIMAIDDGSGCMGSIMIPRLTQPEFLEKGKTVTFTFTPTNRGEYPITCSMGVPRGKIKVI
ncbi:MAG: sulfite exporter TauE/SafE family protein [Patescibacteria group bacterium]